MLITSRVSTEGGGGGGGGEGGDQLQKVSELKIYIYQIFFCIDAAGFYFAHGYHWRQTVHDPVEDIMRYISSELAGLNVF